MELLDAGTLPIMRGPGDLMNMNHRNDQAVRRCSDMEMDGLECMAAYGALRGRKVCKTLVEDYKECVRSLIQTTRVTEMKTERVRQLMRGERKLGELYDSIHPPRDAFIEGPFYN